MWAAYRRGLRQRVATVRHHKGYTPRASRECLRDNTVVATIMNEDTATHQDRLVPALALALALLLLLLLQVTTFSIPIIPAHRRAALINNKMLLQRSLEGRVFRITILHQQITTDVHHMSKPGAGPRSNRNLVLMEHRGCIMLGPRRIFMSRRSLFLRWPETFHPCLHHHRKSSPISQSLTGVMGNHPPGTISCLLGARVLRLFQFMMLGEVVLRVFRA